MINKDELFFESGEPKSFFGFTPVFSNWDFKFIDRWVSPCKNYWIMRAEGDFFLRQIFVPMYLLYTPMKDYKSLEDIIEHYKELTDEKER